MQPDLRPEDALREQLAALPKPERADIELSSPEAQHACLPLLSVLSIPDGAIRPEELVQAVADAVGRCLNIYGNADSQYVASEEHRLVTQREFLKVLAGISLRIDVGVALFHALNKKNPARKKLRKALRAPLHRTLTPSQKAKDPGSYFDAECWNLESLRIGVADEHLCLLGYIAEGLRDQELGMRSAGASIAAAARLAISKREAACEAMPPSRGMLRPLKRFLHRDLPPAPEESPPENRPQETTRDSLGQASSVKPPRFD